MQYTQALDHTVRALNVELHATRARLYQAMEHLMRAVRARIHSESILYPARTEFPSGLEWPEVGGRTPARGPALPLGMQVLHQSVHGMQDPAIVFHNRGHMQLPGYFRCLRR